MSPSSFPAVFSFSLLAIERSLTQLNCPSHECLSALFPPHHNPFFSNHHSPRGPLFPLAPLSHLKSSSTKMRHKRPFNATNVIDFFLSFPPGYWSIGSPPHHPFFVPPASSLLSRRLIQRLRPLPPPTPLEDALSLLFFLLDLLFL